jgi:hypothetical protein
MKNRPTSITVICWILIIMGGISLVVTTINLNNPTVEELISRSPIPVTVQYAIMYVGLLVTLVSGIAMLKGRNWARYLYIVWGVVGFMFSLATSPMKTAMIPGLVVFIIMAFFLFRPKAKAYFTGTWVLSGTESN